MKRILVLLGLLLAVVNTPFAQVNTSDATTREDINRFFDAIQLRQQMQTLMNTITVQAKDNARQMLRKNMPNATPEDISAAEQFMDDALEDPIPVNDLIDAMVPVYQRHLTRTDIDAVVAFYSSPVGQKMLREMPAMMSEGMQAVNEITQKHMEKVMARIREHMKEMMKKPRAPSHQ